MTDFLTEINRLMGHLAASSDVVATALTDPESYLVLSTSPEKYVYGDSWAHGSNMSLEAPIKFANLASRRCSLAGVEVIFLFASPSWACVEPLNPETEKYVRRGLFEIYDPQGLLRSLQAKCDLQSSIGFASNQEITKYADISSDFFRIVGLGEAAFISDGSTLLQWCDNAGLSLSHANARIQEIYDVDVADLQGGRLIDVFERIREGSFYQSWLQVRKVDGTRE